jgi:hypothetical protein
MPIRPNLRVLLALASLVVAAMLPPAALVARYLPPEYATRGAQLYQGLWLFKIALCLNAALWLAWPIAARILDASRPATVPGPVEPPGSLGRGEWAFLGLLTALAAVLRLPGLDSSLTYDEVTFARSMVLKTPLHIFVLGAVNMSQFMNWLAWATTHVVGFSEVSMRLPAFAFGVAVVPVTYLFARRWLGRAEAAGVAALLTVSTQAVIYSQEAKGYSASALFAVGATWSFLEAGRRGWRRDWAIYGLCALGLGFAHMLSMLIIVTHVLLSLILPDRRRLVSPLLVTLAYVAVALGLIFSVSAPLSAQAQATGSEMHYGTAALTDKLVRSLGIPWAPGPWSYAMAAFALVGAFRLGRVNKVLLGVSILPVALGLLLNAYVMKWVYMRYFNFYHPFYLILVSLGAVALGSLVARADRGRGVVLALARVAPLALLALWLWPSSQSLRTYYARERYPFKAVGRWVAALPQGSRVVAGGFGADIYTFYAPGVLQRRDFAAFCDYVMQHRPEYVLTFLEPVYQHDVAVHGFDPLAEYRLAYHVACHVEEDGYREDGFVWRRSPPSRGIVAAQGH